MTPPPYLPAAVLKSPLGYEWDPDIGLSLMRPLPDEHVKLATTFRPVNERAAFAVLLATAEWVIWRIQPHGDVTDALLRLEAGYAALIDPRYATLKPPKGYPDPEVIHGPLHAVAEMMAEGFEAYAAGAAEVKQSAFCMALVARHVAPDPRQFEKWLNASLKRLAAAFPDQERPLADQPVIERAALVAGKATATPNAKAIGAFLGALEPKTNKYLRKKAALQKLALAGEPFRFAGPQG